VTTVVFSERASVDRIVCHGVNAEAERSRSERRGYSVETFDGRRWECVRGCDLESILPALRSAGVMPGVKEDLERGRSEHARPAAVDLVEPFSRACRALQRATPRDRFVAIELVLDRRRVEVSGDGGPLRRDTRDRTLLRFHGDQFAQVELPIRPRGDLATLDWLALLRRARRQAVAASRVPPSSSRKDAAAEMDGRRLDVLFEGGLGGVALHEACGHAFEADAAEAGTALSRRLGQRVAPDFVTLTDDPSLDGGFGSYSVDDEGHQAAPTPLIVGGILRGWLGSARYPAATDSAPGSSGRRADYRSRAYPRMSNLVLEPGRSTRAGLLSRIEGRGLLVETLGIGGESNPYDGTFSLAVRRARLVCRGGIERPVGPLILRGETTGFLRGILAIGRRSRFRPFVTRCEKHGQRIYTDAMSPPMLVRGLVVRAGTGHG
jgi:hypothetical protein